MPPPEYEKNNKGDFNSDNKVTKTKSVFSSDISLKKMLYPASEYVIKK